MGRNSLGDHHLYIDQIPTSVGDELDAEHVEGLLQLVVDPEFITEEYLAALCDGGVDLRGSLTIAGARTSARGFVTF